VNTALSEGTVPFAEPVCAGGGFLLVGFHSRMTFFQDALFAPTPSQRAQFMQIFLVHLD
jgi:hypothetical protein